MFSTFSQQTYGVGVIGFSTDTIFEKVIQIQARTFFGALYTWQVVCAFATYYAVDRVWRRTLTVVGVTDMGTLSAIIADTIS